MIFNGIEHQTVEMRITNYEFPENTNDPWDSNWLNIYLNVKSKLGNWQTTDPSLTTWEVKEIISWFFDLAENKEPKYSELEFTEPNLSFQLLDKHDSPLKLFRIEFDLESRPQSAINDKKYFVDCKADNEELKRIASDLTAELSKYPER